MSNVPEWITKRVAEELAQSRNVRTYPASGKSTPHLCPEARGTVKTHVVIFEDRNSDQCIQFLAITGGDCEWVGDGVVVTL